MPGWNPGSALVHHVTSSLSLPMGGNGTNTTHPIHLTGHYTHGVEAIWAKCKVIQMHSVINFAL